MDVGLLLLFQRLHIQTPEIVESGPLVLEIKYSNFELSTADHSPYSFYKNANTVENKKIFEIIEVPTLLVKSKYESFLKNYPQKLAILY